MSDEPRPERVERRWRVLRPKRALPISRPSRRQAGGLGAATACLASRVPRSNSGSYYLAILMCFVVLALMDPVLDAPIGVARLMKSAPAVRRSATEGRARPRARHGAGSAAVRRADLGARSGTDGRGAAHDPRPRRGGADYDPGDARAVIRVRGLQLRRLHASVSPQKVVEVNAPVWMPIDPSRISLVPRDEAGVFKCRALKPEVDNRSRGVINHSSILVARSRLSSPAGVGVFKLLLPNSESTSTDNWDVFTSRCGWIHA